MPPDHVPFDALEINESYDILVGEELLKIGVVSVGNPHAVFFVEDIVKAPVAKLGPALENHERFPERTNVVFVEVQDQYSLKVRVWERGVGETTACGSGACGAVAVSNKQKKIDQNVSVFLPGGRLSVSWNGIDHLTMTGPAVSVFEGHWTL